MFLKQINQSARAISIRTLIGVAATIVLLSSLTGCEGHNSDNLFFKTGVMQHHWLPAGNPVRSSS